MIGDTKTAIAIVNIADHFSYVTHQLYMRPRLTATENIKLSLTFPVTQPKVI